MCWRVVCDGQRRTGALGAEVGRSAPQTGGVLTVQEEAELFVDMMADSAPTWFPVLIYGLKEFSQPQS